MLKKTKLIYLIGVIGLLLAILIGILIYNFYGNITIPERKNISTNLFASAVIKSDDTISLQGYIFLKDNYVFVDKDLVIKGKKLKSIANSIDALCFADEQGKVYKIKNKALIDNKIITNENIVKIKELTRIVKIVAGESHFLALDKKGNVWGWGSNEYGQIDPRILSDDASVPKEFKAKKEYTIPKKIIIDSNVVAVNIKAAYYTSVVMTKVEAYIFGENNAQLQKPVSEGKEISNFGGFNQMAPPRAISELAIGRNHIIVEAKDKLYMFGRKNQGQALSSEEKDRYTLKYKNVSKFACSMFASYYLMMGKLKHTNAFGELENYPVQKNHGKISDFDCVGDYLTIVYEDGYIERKNENFENVEYDPQVDNAIIKIAAIDTGVYFNNEYIKEANANAQEEALNLQKSDWNFYDNSSEMFYDAQTDTHGTQVFGLLSGYKFKGYDLVSYDKNIGVLSLKALNSSHAKFVDIFNAIIYAKKQNVDIVNCSFSLNRTLYHMPFSVLIDTTPSLFVMSLKNGNEKTSFSNNGKGNILFAYQQIEENEPIDKVNYIGVLAPSKLFKVISLGDNKLAALAGNSFATAVLSNYVASLNLHQGIDFIRDDILEHINERTIKYVN